MKKTFYQILGLPEIANRAAIVEAHTRLRSKCTERSPRGDVDARNELVALTIAYEIFSSVEKRKACDEQLATAQLNGQALAIVNPRILVHRLTFLVCGLMPIRVAHPTP